MLKVQNVDVSYGPINALFNASIEIRDQEIVSVIGANGAGKSTLMKAIVGLCKIKSGKILFQEERIDVMETHQIVRKGIVLVPEGRRIFPKMTVLENLEVGAFGHKHPAPADLEEVYSYFPRLRERRHQEAGTLSGGEQQMLAVGRGLMAKPRLLMLDEPSMGLAPIVVDEVFEVITRINREAKIPILLVEQNAFMALEISEKCYVLENGAVCMSGSSTQLRDSPQVKEAYLGG